jgi:ribosomal protein S18 acetylase RimI-like enzyme
LSEAIDSRVRRGDCGCVFYLAKEQGVWLVRIANTEDIVSISQLYDEFFKYNNDLQPSFCAAVKESGLYPQSVIDEATGDIFVAEIDSAIVGFIHVEEDKTSSYPSVVQHRFACIVDFYVMHDYSKCGLGKALLEKVKDWSIKRELEYIELFVLEENSAGKSFYKQENFSITSHTMRYIL